MVTKTKLEKDIDKLRLLSDNDPSLEEFFSTIQSMDRAMRDYIISYRYHAMDDREIESHYVKFKSILGIQ